MSLVFWLPCVGIQYPCQRSLLCSWLMVRRSGLLFVVLELNVDGDHNEQRGQKTSSTAKDRNLRSATRSAHRG